MPTRRLSTAGICLSLLAAPVVWGDGAANEPERLDESTETAIYLMRMTTRVYRNGQHHVLHRALRQLRDPALRPLFGSLAESAHPDLQIHGILGLAEGAEGSQLDLAQLASVKSPLVQADLVSHALDHDMMTNDQATQLLEWNEQVDLAVKVLVSARLIRDKQFDKKEILNEALNADNLARKSLAALLLLQLGEPEARKTLDELDASADEVRDQVRSMLIGTALRFDFDQVGPWALKIAGEPDAETKLQIIALRAALRFGGAEAEGLWSQLFESSSDPAELTRLAMVVLTLAHEGQSNLEGAMEASDVPLIQRIGAASTAIGNGSGVVERIGDLIELDHSMVSEWVLTYAKRHASDPDSIQILEQVILAAPGPARSRAVRMDNVVRATQILFEKSRDDAIAILGPVLASPQSPDRLKQGILYGLLRCNSDSGADEVIAGLKPFDRPTTRKLALLLLAKHRDELTEDQLHRLGLLVRGNLNGPLRLQAAWRYLSLTNQTEAALVRVMDH